MNYYERLNEAYLEIKRLNIKDYSDFSTREDLKIGAFTYSEITIFDRIRSSEYEKMLVEAWGELHNHTEEYRNQPDIGDRLASWGTLGSTPYRQDLIDEGYIVNGLTKEEANRHFEM